MADIATCDGTKISYEAYEGRCSNELQDHLQWSRSPIKLSTSFWELWKKAIRKSLVKNYSRQLELSTTLGTWQPESLSKWKWVFSEDDNRIYHQEGLLWRGFARQTGRRSKNNFNWTDALYHIPPDGTPISIKPVSYTHLTLPTKA